MAEHHYLAFSNIVLRYLANVHGNRINSDDRRFLLPSDEVENAGYIKANYVRTRLFGNDMTEIQFQFIADMLKDDDYIEVVKSQDVYYYRIKYKGAFFIENDGYTAKYRKERLKRIREMAVIALTLLIGLATVFVSYLQYRVSKIDTDSKQSLKESRLLLSQSDSMLQLQKHQIDSLIGIVSKGTPSTGTK